MMDVLEQYETAYNPKHPRVNLDEKLWQLLITPRGHRLSQPGKPKREDYEYQRRGTTNLFVCVEPKTGKRHCRVTHRRCKRDFAKFIRFIVMDVYKEADVVHIILDNLNTHTDQAIMDQYGEELGNKICERIKWHYTPAHASWLNTAEIEISVIEKRLRRRRIASKVELTKHVRAIQRRRNHHQARINWQFTREDARDKFKLHKN